MYAANEPNSCGTQQVEPQLLMAYILTSGPVLYTIVSPIAYHASLLEKSGLPRQFSRLTSFGELHHSNGNKPTFEESVSRILPGFSDPITLVAVSL